MQHELALKETCEVGICGCRGRNKPGSSAGGKRGALLELKQRMYGEIQAIPPMCVATDHLLAEGLIKMFLGDLLEILHLGAARHG